MILQIETDDLGDEMYRSTYTYDDRGLLLTKHNRDVYGSDSENYTYNAADQVTWKKTTISDGGLLEAVEYAYNPAGKLTREICYDEDMEPWQLIISNNDNKNILLETRHYSLPDTINPSQIKKYVSNGKKIEDTEFNKDRSKTISMKISYDEMGNLINITYLTNGIADPTQSVSTPGYTKPHF